MIRQCKTCGKSNTCQPYKDARTVKYDCVSDCEYKRRGPRVIHRKIKMVLKARSIRG